MAKADTATLQASPELLSLPPIAVDNILRAASFSGALAACSCRALQDAWRELTSDPEFAATALVDRFKTVDAAAEHLYKPGHGLLRDPPLKSNIAPPAPGLLDAVASPLLSTLSALLKKRTPVPTLSYLTATAAPDAHALRLLRHLTSLREGAARESGPAPVSQANNGGVGDIASQGGTVASQEQAVPTITLFPRSVITGAAFAGHEATVVELLRHGTNPIEVLPGAVRAGNARLCAALLEGARMAGAACDWSTAAGGRVLGVHGGPSGFANRYAGSSKAAFHMGMNRELLPLACIGLPPGLPGGSGGDGSGGGACSGSSSISGSSGGASDVCARGVSTRGLLQRAVGGWCSEDAGHEQPEMDVAAALAAARAASEKAADAALGSSNPLLPLLVKSSTAAAAAAAAAATAAALAALTPPEASCSGSGSGCGGDSEGGGGSSSAHHPGQACASLSSTTDHAAVRQLLLQWRPAEWQALPPHARASALLYAAAGGAWPVVSELLREGVDPRDTGAPATVLYLALVQGRGAMAAWLLVRLLAHPVGLFRIVGAPVAALMTVIMGLASPLQLLLRYKPVSFLEGVLDIIGCAVVYWLAFYLLPDIFLPQPLFNVIPCLVYAMWLWPR